MPLVFTEQFNNLTAWTTTGTPTLVTGRTGNGVAVTVGQTAKYIIPGVSESDTVTVGFAWKTDATGSREIIHLRSDTAATNHVVFAQHSSGFLYFLRGDGTTIAQSATGMFSLNTWYYLELQVRLDNTVGFARLLKNGVSVIDASGLDTRNAGTKTVFDAITLVRSTGGTNTFDDLYLRNDAVFQGDLASFAEARLARASDRLLTTGVPIAQAAKLSLAGLFPLNVVEGQLAQIGLRAVVTIPPTPPAGVNVKVWTGTEFVDSAVVLWSGSEFVDAEGVKIWDGAAFTDQP